MSFAYGLLGVVLFVIMTPVMQVIVRRASIAIPPVIVLAIAAVTAHGISVLLGAATMQHFKYWNAASIFGFGVMGYVFAFGAVYKSVSLEIMLDLAQRAGRTVPLSDIVDRQVPDIFRGRANILIDSGFVERAGSSFTATVAGRKLAGRIAAVRRAFAIGDTGLYDFGDPGSSPMNHVDEAAESSKQAHVYLWLGLSLAVLASIPALVTRGLYADDWTVYFFSWTEGAKGVARLMWQGGHGGYTVPMLIFTELGSSMPNVATRVIGLLCHLINGVLFFRLLRRYRRTEPIAGLATALFLLTPFYAIRMTLNANYDFFLTFYFLSYELMDARSRALHGLAPISLLFSLSLETLIACELLRVLLLSERVDRLRGLIVRLMPFGIAVLVAAVLRFTLLQKSGHYADQYPFRFDWTLFTTSLSLHIQGFQAALELAFTYAIGLFGPLAAALLAGAMLAITPLTGRLMDLPWLLRSRQTIKNTALLMLTGAGILTLGGVPYALVGIYAWPTRGESRLAFPSQIGALLLMAAILQCVAPGLTRRAIAALILLGCVLSTAHDSKWLAYEGLITSDIQRQTLAALTADDTPKLVELKIEPPTGKFAFRGRCLGANDLNPAHVILSASGAPTSFVYEPNCGDFTNPVFVPSGHCPVSYVDGYPCPERRETWLYRLPEPIDSVDRIGLIDLMVQSISPIMDRGELVKLSGNTKVSLPRAEARPPCDRRGVAANLWLLALPKNQCR